MLKLFKDVERGGENFLALHEACPKVCVLPALD